MAKNHLNVFRPDTKVPRPPRTLSAPGASLWARITEEYQIDDAGGRELLCLACETLDRVQSLRELIDAEGEVVRTKAGLKDHPALRHELAGRAFISKCLTRLGLSVEATNRPVGRPPGPGFGIDAEYRRHLLNED
jgi:P27 family predicted phage terminase small subunit